jgi:hypothetical protein
MALAAKYLQVAAKCLEAVEAKYYLPKVEHHPKYQAAHQANYCLDYRQ